MKAYTLAVAVLVGFSGTLSIAQSSTQTLQIGSEVQIPGATLKAGTYTFSVEDRLTDRAVVRVESQRSDKHYLLLAVPSEKLNESSSGEFVYFSVQKDGKQILRAWKCADCSAALEFAYPKLEAVKITDFTTVPVLAVDPAYDKLPENLSRDDMKVVTLWLLSPEHITSDNVGKGVKAAKYTATQPAGAESLQALNRVPAAPNTRSNPVQPEPPALPANATAPHAKAATAAVSAAAPHPSPVPPLSTRTSSRVKTLPKTGTDTAAMALFSLALMVSAGTLRFKRTRQGI